MTSLAAGVDGCRGGWLVAVIDESYSMLEGYLVEKLSDFDWAEISIPILIDMPIGLPTENSPTRLCDTEARKLLKRRASTIFSPPACEALLSENYTEACDVNQQLTGKRISKQVWNLREKILELQRFPLRSRFLESHPELCFYGLGGKVIMESKKSAAGFAARKELLSKFLPTLSDAFDVNRSKYPRSRVSDDDILDSFVLALASRRIIDKVESQVCLPTEIDGAPVLGVASITYAKGA